MSRIIVELTLELGNISARNLERAIANWIIKEISKKTWFNKTDLCLTEQNTVPVDMYVMYSIWLQCIVMYNHVLYCTVFVSYPLFVTVLHNRQILSNGGSWERRERRACRGGEWDREGRERRSAQQQTRAARRGSSGEDRRRPHRRHVRCWRCSCNCGHPTNIAGLTVCEL